MSKQQIETATLLNAVEKMMSKEKRREQKLGKGGCKQLSHNEQPSKMMVIDRQKITAPKGNSAQNQNSQHQTYSASSLSQMSSATDLSSPRNKNRNSLYENNRIKLTHTRAPLVVPNRNSGSNEETETVYSSFSEQDQVSIPMDEIKLQSGSTYTGLRSPSPQRETPIHEQQRSGTQIQKPQVQAIQAATWVARTYYSTTYKFPIIKSKMTKKESLEKTMQFSKANNNLQEAINSLFEASPFKRGSLCQNKENTSSIIMNDLPVPLKDSFVKRLNNHSFQSEDVIDTNEELGAFDEEEEENKTNIDQCNLTVDEHSKIGNSKDRESEIQKSSRKNVNASDGQATALDQRQLQQNTKVFALDRDEYHSIVDTSFETIKSEHLFAQTTEDFSASGVKQSGMVSKVTSEGGNDDSFIEQELQKIQKNLNTFTVEHFNALRQQIQVNGFQKAAHQAKKDFNLITDSTTTLVSIKEDDNELTSTEETRMANQLNIVYNSNSVTASKNILLLHERETGNVVKRNSAHSNVDAASPLFRKLLICEMGNQKSKDQVEILHASSCSGFNSTPLLYFGDHHSYAYVDKSMQAASVYNCLLSSNILRSFVCTPVQWVSCGFEHCLALTVFGGVASWGCGASGCLGHDNYISYTNPRFIQGLVEHSISYIECGGYHNAAISEDGSLYTWGRGDVGQLGVPKVELQEDEMGFVLLKPKPLQFLKKSQRKFKQVALGEAHTVVLDDKGSVYTFGWGELGQIGMKGVKANDELQFKVNRIQLFDTFPCKRVAAGAIFSAALTLRGRIYTWGSGQYGQLGLGNVKQSEIPVFVDFLSEEKVVDIVCGDAHTLAITDKGDVYGWGQGVSRSKSLATYYDDSIINSASSLSKENSDSGPSQKMDNLETEQFQVECFFPKQLSEVDIVHPFLLKKKSANSEQVIDLSKESRGVIKDAQLSMKHLYQAPGRNLPSNNTICEVSERDSEYDEKSRTLKRSDLKTLQGTIVTNESARRKPTEERNLNLTTQLVSQHSNIMDNSAAKNQGSNPSTHSKKLSGKKKSCHQPNQSTLKLDSTRLKQTSLMIDTPQSITTASGKAMPQTVKGKDSLKDDFYRRMEEYTHGFNTAQQHSTMANALRSPGNSTTTNKKAMRNVPSKFKESIISDSTTDNVPSRHIRQMSSLGSESMINTSSILGRSILTNKDDSRIKSPESVIGKFPGTTKHNQAPKQLCMQEIAKPKNTRGCATALGQSKMSAQSSPIVAHPSSARNRNQTNKLINGQPGVCISNPSNKKVINNSKPHVTPASVNSIISPTRKILHKRTNSGAFTFKEVHMSQLVNQSRTAASSLAHRNGVKPSPRTSGTKNQL